MRHASAAKLAASVASSAPDLSRLRLSPVAMVFTSWRQRGTRDGGGASRRHRRREHDAAPAATARRVHEVGWQWLGTCVRRPRRWPEATKSPSSDHLCARHALVELILSYWGPRKRGGQVLARGGAAARTL